MPPLSLNRYLPHSMIPPWQLPNLINKPHPDQGLFSTEPPSASNIADDAAKLNIVSSDFRSNPETTTSVSSPQWTHREEQYTSGEREAKGKAKRYLSEAEEESFYLYGRAKHYLFRPGVAGGLIGLGMHGISSLMQVLADQSVSQ